MRVVTDVVFQERWEPDEQLVPSLLAQPRSARKMSSFPIADRCWLVAGLTAHGLTASEIAHKMWCCVRQVKAIRAEDLYQVCFLMQREAKTFTDEVRLVRTELTATAQTLAETEAEAARLRGQVDNLITARMNGGGECSKGHAMTPYNTYVQPKTGKRFCRECHRERQSGYRRRPKTCTSSTSSTVSV